MNVQTKVKAETEWRDIPEHPGYRVGSNGSIWSERSARCIVGSKAGRGYRFVQLPNGREYIHRLVCSAFHGCSTQEQQVRHLDGDLTNNRASNLAWGTKAENEADKFQHGTTPRGERNPQAKLRRELVNEMRQLRASSGQSYQRIAAHYGVSAMTAFRAITGESWA